MSDRDLIEWDWLATSYGSRLHHATLGPTQADWVVEVGALANQALTCDRNVRAAWTPGPFDRLNAPRCARCCDALGYPRGIGSPKNDPACRPLVEARIGGGL